MKAFIISARQPDGSRVCFINPLSCPDTSREEAACLRIFKQVQSSTLNAEARMDAVDFDFTTKRVVP